MGAEREKRWETMTEGKKPFWHEIARQVERYANAKPLTDDEFDELIRRCRANAQALPKHADEIDKSGKIKKRGK
jgi:hypothetical protein